MNINTKQTCCKHGQYKPNQEVHEVDRMSVLLEIKLIKFQCYILHLLFSYL